MARPKSHLPASNRSFRCPDKVWAAARVRATQDGLSVSAAIVELLEGYGRGAYVMPKVSKSYVKPTSASSTSSSSEPTA